MSDDEEQPEEGESTETAAEETPRVVARPGPPGGPKRSKAQIELYLQEVEVLILYNHGRPQVEAAMAKHGVSPRTAQKYMAMVAERWRQHASATRDDRRERQINRLYAQIRMLEGGRRRKDGVLLVKHSEIVKRERLIAQIEGNLAPQQHEHTITKKKWNELTPEQIEHIARTGELPPDVRREELDE